MGRCCVVAARTSGDPFLLFVPCLKFHSLIALAILRSTTSRFVFFIPTPCRRNQSRPPTDSRLHLYPVHASLFLEPRLNFRIRHVDSSFCFDTVTMLLELNMNNREQCESVMIFPRQMRMEDVADTVEGRLLTDRKGDWGGGVVSNWMVLRNLVGLNDGQFGWMTTVASQVPAWSTCASDGFSCLVGDDTSL
ncbi:hypothetical protein BLNAU_11105 [Blattamonas nauphoetae]|uniref:Uncharacterized protein n=1 Tax=Blattamonas nauphoetae TaxID=2049346 RepID=A0ABQ9XRD7_9EUKA|nr:hypothetical protein BLNAU_11105 [Blattamonas nauphoetae]